MNDEVKGWYAALPNSRKQVFLALVSHELTVHGRGVAADLNRDNQITVLKGLNEMQHLISGCVVGLGTPSDVGQNADILDALQRKAAIYSLTSHLEQSLASAWSRSLEIKPL